MTEVYLCDYIRTPFGRYGGALSAVRTDDLAAIPLQALLARNPKLDPRAIEDVILGCANQAGEDNRNVARMALLLAGYPETVTGTTINRLCGSGMDAVLAASRMIRCGEAEVVIAGGVENMSRAPLVQPKATQPFSRNAEIYDTTLGWRFINPKMHSTYGTDAMPETGENVAADFAISRADQDLFAWRSQQRAYAATNAGIFAEEITPVSISQRKGEPVLVTTDEHPRPQTDLAQLAQLPTPFRQPGTVTAGNASGLNDGAAALILASARAVQTYGLRPIARILGGATAGVAPRIMGIGPAPATAKLCARLGWSVAQLDALEINEAFAAQALATLRQLGLADDAPQVNPNGGAIALGHPLGASGARITGTLALHLQRTQGHKGIATMCIGVGQGIAIALEGVGESFNKQGR